MLVVVQVAEVAALDIGLDCGGDSGSDGDVLDLLLDDDHADVLAVGDGLGADDGEVTIVEAGRLGRGRRGRGGGSRRSGRGGRSRGRGGGARGGGARGGGGRGRGGRGGRRRGFRLLAGGDLEDAPLEDARGAGRVGHLGDLGSGGDDRRRRADGRLGAVENGDLAREGFADDAFAVLLGDNTGSLELALALVVLTLQGEEGAVRKLA